MKHKLLITIVGVSLCTWVLYAQRPAKSTISSGTTTTGTPQVNMNNLKMADTTYLKIKSLQDENAKQRKEIDEMKATLDALSSKMKDTEKDVFGLKVTASGLNSFVGNIKAPVAYATFIPKLDPATHGYGYEMENEFGIVGKPVQIYSSVEITLSHSFVNEPVVVTTAGEDHINTKLPSRAASVLYYRTAPNKIRLQLVKENSETIIAPFSVVIYGE